MIKLKYTTFMSFPFTQAMQKLASTPFPIKVSYEIKKLADAMQKQRGVIQGEYIAMMKKFAKVSPEGEPVVSTTVPNAFEIDDAQKAAYELEEKAFGEKEFTIDRSPLLVESLGAVQFTPSDLSLLESVIVDRLPAADNVVPMTSA